MPERDPSIEPLVRAVYQLTAVKRDIPRLAGFDHPVGLVPLAAVYECAPARVKDLAEHLHVDLSVASRQIAALEAAGYVRRQPDPADRRSARVSITQAGEDALHRAHDRIVDVFASVLARWSRDDVEALTTALGRLREDYDRVTGHPHSTPTTEEAA